MEPRREPPAGGRCEAFNIHRGPPACLISVGTSLYDKPVYLLTANIRQHEVLLP